MILHDVPPRRRLRPWAVALALVVPALAAPLRAADAPSVTDETPAQFAERMKWFNEARFGMFIHWGVYAVPAGEWQGKTGYGEWFLEETHMPVSQYEQFAKQFNPVKFDAKAWVQIAKNAGMKYIVITSKHHDGFGMYPSKLTDWCISATPFKRDPLKELSDACREAGLKFCTYHSIMDWHSSDWGNRRAWNDKATGKPDMDRFYEYLKGQLTEIVTSYHPAIMWFDGEWEAPWTHDYAVQLYAYLRGLDPTLIINNRIDKHRAGMAGMTTSKESVGDYGTPEQTIPATGFPPGVYWESCMTLNNHWGYNSHDKNWKSTQTILRNVVDIASKGGNYLLNVGPTAEGLIPDGSVQRLAEVGAWMKVNGESIWGTSASPFRRLPWGRATQKGTKLYLHVFDWPADGKLLVPVVSGVDDAALLTRPGRPLPATTDAEGLHLTLPAKAPDVNDSVIVLNTNGEIKVLDTPAIAQAGDGVVRLDATTAEIVGGQARLQGDNIGYWVDAADYLRWSFKVTKPGTFTPVLTYSLDTGSDGSEIAVEAGGQKTTAKLAATGSWDKYTTIQLPPLALTATGPVTVTVKGTKKPGLAVMNYKLLVLTPKP